MATYGYARVSTAEQVDGTSLAEQERKIRGLAMMRGEEIAEVFVDGGVSGSADLESRPQGSRLVAVLRKGDVLIVAKLDRAFRDAADALVKVKQWKAAGVKLILADMGNEPVNENGHSQLFFTILAGFAEWERTRILERTASGRDAKKAAGGHIGGSAPFGFDKAKDEHGVEYSGKAARLVPNRTQQAAIETIREARAAGFSLRATAELAAQKHGIKVTYETVRRLEARENANDE
jgi:DNA invertase Pin-like site-specific DNA recombinase